MPFNHFDVIASLYNRTAQFSVTAPLLDLLDLPPNGLLLDIGGGTGRVAEALRNMVHETVVVDPSRGMLLHAANKGLVTTCAPAEHLPFASSTFDRIIMVDTLHHVFNQRQTVTDLWRVLAPAGRIIVIEPDIHRFTVKLIAIGEKMLLMRSHFLPAVEIAALFVSHNTHVQVIANDLNIWICAEKVR
jgi:ubiquinone/menaquinone biosynthesis C-methylase UbiE